MFNKYIYGVKIGTYNPPLTIIRRCLVIIPFKILQILITIIIFIGWGKASAIDVWNNLN